MFNRTPVNMTNSVEMAERFGVDPVALSLQIAAARRDGKAIYVTETPDAYIVAIEKAYPKRRN